MSKQETLEEFSERIARAFDNDNYKSLMELVFDGAKWQEQNSDKKYSEEDIYLILEKFRNLPLIQFQEWFEQFKNK